MGGQATQITILRASGGLRLGPALVFPLLPQIVAEFHDNPLIAPRHLLPGFREKSSEVLPELTGEYAGLSRKVQDFVRAARSGQAWATIWASISWNFAFRTE